MHKALTGCLLAAAGQLRALHCTSEAHPTNNIGVGIGGPGGQGARAFPIFYP